MTRPRKSRSAARVLVSSVAGAKAKRFGGLVTRELHGAAVVGDASMLYEELPPWTRLPEIRHAGTGEWILVLEGSMTAYLEGKARRVRAGAVIAIPPGAAHRFVTRASSCKALSVFSPALRIGPGADIISTP